MSRPVIDIDANAEGLRELAEAPHPGPVRFASVNPRRGGPRVKEIRAALSPKGRVRISGTTARLFVDFDPGEVEEPVVALNTIVRSDADGLERMILSALPHVDQVVIGIDRRSDTETAAVVRAYADESTVFDADDIGMTEEAWAANKIDFAAARNWTLHSVSAPWSLVVDSDEFVSDAGDIRKLCREAPDGVGGFAVLVRVDEAFKHADPQRLCRTRYRWTSATHNQLVFSEAVVEPPVVTVQHDLSLRSISERVRRSEQRDLGIEELVEEAGQGNIVALFHLAKHKATKGDISEAVKLVEDYRLRLEPNGLGADERAWSALTLAFRYYNEDNMIEANRWGVRAILDGPRVTAFCLLGDVAEADGDLVRARGWYEAACALTTQSRIEWPGLTELRHGRLAGIVRALRDPATADALVDVDESALLGQGHDQHEREHPATDVQDVALLHDADAGQTD